MCRPTGLTRLTKLAQDVQVNLRLPLGVRPSQSNSVGIAFFLLFGPHGLRTFIGGALLRNIGFRGYSRLGRGCSRVRIPVTGVTIFVSFKTSADAMKSLALRQTTSGRNA